MKYLIAHHLGMGDHIVLNGLVRNIYARERAKGKTVYLLCYDKNEKNVKDMYRDIDIHLVLLDNSNEIGMKISGFHGEVEDLHLWGQEKYPYGKYADEAFYLNFGYPVSLMQEFKILRGIQREAVAEKELDATGDYIFVHDDPARNLNINPDHLPKGIKIVRPGTKIPMFELLSVMEKAKECHFISSSFLCIALAYKGLVKNATAHLYLKNDFLAPYLNKYGIKTIV